ncbi:MAG: hypothetical protein J0I07_37345, partial [Myxococcales bacterium]|nr:hypothetical protein [Myxococcales bacterium]
APSRPAPSEDCGDVANDATNCGFCGHSCGGAACSAGLCAPAVVARASTHVDAFVTDGVGLYTIDAQAVRSCAASGPATQACPELVTGEEIGSRLRMDDVDWGDWGWGGKGKELTSMPAIAPTAIALQSNRVVIADGTYEVVVVCPTKVPCTRINVGIVDTDDDAPVLGRSLTLSSSRLFWAQGNAIRTSPVPVPGLIVHASASRAASDTVDPARVLAAGADDLFWLSSEGLHSAKDVSANAERLSARDARDFAVDDGNAYLASASGLYRVSRADRTETLAATGTFAHVVADARGIYATRIDGGRTTVVDVRSGKVLELARVDFAVDGLAVAGEYVYFMTHASGAAEILRVPR